MARRGASSSRVSAPSKPTTASKPAPSKAPATTSKSSTPTTTSNQQSQAPQVVMQGPGLLSTMASSMAGAVAGNVIGHALVGGVSSMMGGSNQEAAPQIPQTTNAVDENTCTPIYKSFMTCLEKNQNDLASCQWVYDSFLDCKKGGNGDKFY
ncbi:hypothetical protein DFA_05798 [Cavenderia fasciculata]|uniref:CHCH domain-containing protein n=1 Tax=Cavenderia fasciculata TaxID=261658 RepID=F4PMS0_CACFS|nr:uncharacterized protein DFA_05798 [Cavenderia fasciculata]EGG23664.1 hypothetical protein DFA_05798 [Cavenderia fasciculata]|eukprot:XP_004361515.1 hypothetical protein DFA_05798 [Cavenderia fasciculata]